MNLKILKHLISIVISISVFVLGLGSSGCFWTRQSLLRTSHGKRQSKFSDLVAAGNAVTETGWVFGSDE